MLAPSLDSRAAPATGWRAGRAAAPQLKERAVAQLQGSGKYNRVLLKAANGALYPRQHPDPACARQQCSLVSLPCCSRRASGSRCLPPLPNQAFLEAARSVPLRCCRQVQHLSTARPLRGLHALLSCSHPCHFAWHAATAGRGGRRGRSQQGVPPTPALPSAGARSVVWGELTPTDRPGTPPPMLPPARAAGGGLPTAGEPGGAARPPARLPHRLSNRSASSLPAAPVCSQHMLLPLAHFCMDGAGQAAEGPRPPVAPAVSF